MLAGVVEDQKLVPFDHGDVHAPSQQRIHPVPGQLSQAAVEKFDQVVAGMESGQLLVPHQQLVPPLLGRSSPDKVDSHNAKKI